MIGQVLEHASKQYRTTPHIAHRLVARGSVRRERRDSLNIQSGLGCRSCTRDSQQRGGRRCRRPCGRGAMSMAAGEYVSVHSQADTENADLQLERAELKTDDRGEHIELAAIYVARGLDPVLAKQVAQQLMAHDAIGAHARDELRICDASRAHPIQAALASACSFAVGAVMPLLVASMASRAMVIPLVAGSSLMFLALLAGLAAHAGGAGVLVGALRVTFWGALAMAVTPE